MFFFIGKIKHSLFLRKIRKFFFFKNNNFLWYLSFYLVFNVFFLVFLFTNFIENYFNKRHYLNKNQIIAEQKTNFSQGEISPKESTSTRSSFASYLSKSEGGLNLKATDESSFLLGSLSNHSALEFLKYEDQNIYHLKFANYLEKNFFFKSLCFDRI